MSTKRRPARISALEPRILRALFACACVLAALCACDTRRSSADPIEACVELTRAAESCYGSRVAARFRASFSHAPTDEPSREKLSAKCTEQRARVKRVCR